ncbi:MAG: hypothetical protein OEY38_17295 [Gammaproteobacteria bacterium]|nr:hypothetical protein [Gammaproteobacteria bacterium]
MAFKMDQPLYSLSDEAEQKEILALWEKEKHGGLSEGNNRIPFPITFLLGLIILTAFMITMPIWGQRPTADIYVDYVALMDSAEVQSMATPEEKMNYIAKTAYAKADARRQGALERHPLAWDDLLNIAPQIKEIQSGKGKYPLDNYNVLGDRIALANFEGNFTEGGYRERKQPWWDLGYTIDVFYVSYFLITMVIVIKRLPHFSRKPNLG